MTTPNPNPDEDQLFDGVVLVCDGCRQTSLNHRDHGTRAELRAAVDAKATALGWKLQDDVTLCPNCQRAGRQLS